MCIRDRIKKEIRDLISITKTNEAEVAEDTVNYSAMNKKERQEAIKKLQKQMHEAAELLDFELAAQIRDMVLEAVSYTHLDVYKRQPINLINYVKSV